jgi:hypothetical protein
MSVLRKATGIPTLGYITLPSKEDSEDDDNIIHSFIYICIYRPDFPKDYLPVTKERFEADSNHPQNYKKLLEILPDATEDSKMQAVAMYTDGLD